jgi:type IV secretion system protein VirB4
VGGHDDWNTTLQNIAADTLTISTYQCRGMADPAFYPLRSYPSAFATGLSKRYRESLFDRSLFNNQLYIGLTISPARYAGDMVAEQIAKRRKAADDAPEDRIQRLLDICALIEAKMANYGVHRLGVVERRNALFSEIAEAIVFAMTGIWRPIGLTTGRMSSSMFSERIITGREAIEIRTPGWSSFAAMFGMREYPATTWPGMFSALSVAQYRCTLFQSFRFLAKATADSIMNRKQNFMIGAGDKAYEQIEELRVAGNDLMANKFVMGGHTLSVIAFADSMRQLTGVATTAWRDVADSGVVVAREGLALEAALLSLVPGNNKFWPRPGYLSSRNFAAMAPLHNFPQGPKRGHWGAPIAIFRGIGGTPYRFHWHVGDVGNTLITGETGSGKSLLAGFLIAMTTGRARVFAFDYKRGWELLFRALEGRYAVLGNGQPHLSPLKALDPTPKSMQFLNELIRGCTRQELTGEEDRRLALGLATVMSMPAEDRSMGEIMAFLGTNPNGAGAALAKWCYGNDLGWVIDAPVDTIDMTGDLNGYDMTALLDNPRARGPAMLTLFHYLELQIDGRPILIPNDEGWKALLDETFRPMIETRLRTIRSFGGVFVFLTQGPGEIKASDIANVLIEQCPTQIRLPVDRATKEDYVNVLKSTEGEWDAFRPLKKGSGMFLMVQGGSASVVELPLDRMEDEIATLSARQETLNVLDKLRAEAAPMKTKAMLEEVHRQRRMLVLEREGAEL